MMGIFGKQIGNPTASGVGLPVGTKVYRALLTQRDTNAPVATVRENTLGADVTWVYSDTGIYAAELDLPVLTEGKTCLPPLNASQTMEGSSKFVATSVYYINSTELRVETAIADIGTGTLTLTDDLLTSSYVEILVYP